LSVALERRRFVPLHERGQVLVDVATVLTAGGEAIADIETLRHHDSLLARSHRRRRYGGPLTR
jgi:hypothetical protein